jgi:hypothetical protein
MSEADQQSSTAWFYASPNEALQAPPEALLYLACLHEGTGVRDELPHFGWNRRSSACHGPGRSHLIGWTRLSGTTPREEAGGWL